MDHDKFLHIVEEHFDDVPTFIDVHRGELDELFETGSVTLTYPGPDGKVVEFTVSLKFEEA